ncbi:hypothetical protein Goshw_022494, partial [Gossypium schwendimanii]|nr:hypothetical protein [Gossypium schwendimanii]
DIPGISRFEISYSKNIPKISHLGSVLLVPGSVVFVFSLNFLPVWTGLFVVLIPHRDISCLGYPSLGISYLRIPQPWYIPFQGYLSLGSRGLGLGLGWCFWASVSVFGAVDPLGFMNNPDFKLASPDISPAIKLHRFIPSSFVGYRLRSTPGEQDVWEYDSVLFDETQAENEANRVE